MNFEWDDDKANANFKKHGVSFTEAREAFLDENVIEELEDSIFYGEDRWKITGSIGNRLITVIYTLRNVKVRIISARKATAHERQDYHFQTRS